MALPVIAPIAWTSVAIALFVSAGALGQVRLPAYGTLATTSPAFLYPDSNRPPVATLQEGTPVRVLGAERGWYHIEFEDTTGGTRAAFVRATSVLVGDPVSSTLLEITDPSPRATATAPAPTPKTASGSQPQRTEQPVIDSALRHLGSTRDLVARAIASGLKRRGQKTGLALAASSQRITFRTATSDSASIEIRVRIYSPLAWLEQVASDAAKENRTFALSDVTPELLEPVVRVIVDAVTRETPEITGALLVRQVVLRDAQRRIVVHPTSKELLTDVIAASEGVPELLHRVRVTFPHGSLGEIGDNGSGVTVTVIDRSGGERDFTITRRQFERLRD